MRTTIPNPALTRIAKDRFQQVHDGLWILWGNVVLTSWAVAVTSWAFEAWNPGPLLQNLWGRGSLRRLVDLVTRGTLHRRKIGELLLKLKVEPGVWWNWKDFFVYEPDPVDATKRQAEIWSSLFLTLSDPFMVILALSQAQLGTTRYHHPSARVSQLGLDETTTVDVARKVWLRPAEQRLGRHVAWDVQDEGEMNRFNSGGSYCFSLPSGNLT